MVADLGTSLPVTRRRLLGGAAMGTAVAAASVAGLAHADLTPAGFAELRARWRTLTLGPPFDPADPDFATALDGINNLAQQASSRIVTDPNRTQVFVDLPFHDGNSARMYQTTDRLRNMAVAYVTPGASRHGDATLVTQVLDGLESLYTLVYNENSSEYDNWYHWEIAAPLRLIDTYIYLYDHIPADRRTKYIATLDHFNTDPGFAYQAPSLDFPNRVPAVSTGANRVLLCRNVVTRGVLGDAGDPIVLAMSRLTPSLAYARLDVVNFGAINDGFYPDGSFIQHRTSPSTGTYGSDLLASVSVILGLLGGTEWAANDPNVANIFRAVDITFAPIIYNGNRLESVMDRAVTRGRSNVPANGIIGAVLEMAAGMDPATAQRWRGMCKGWLQRHPTYPDFLAGLPVVQRVAFRNVLDDPSVEAVPEPSGVVVLPRMGRVVHRGQGWAVAIATSSERVKHYETMDGENLRGFHMAAGMTYLYTDAAASLYRGDYWPTSNPYGHAGTTVDTRPLPNAAGPVRPDNLWGSGAVLDGRVAAVGHDLKGLASSMTAHKSWFCLPDRIVALGAGITDSVAAAEGYPVVTTMEHRLLDLEGDHTLTVDGQVQPSTAGWQATFAGASWAHLASTAGYVVLDPSTPLKGSRQDRTGRWIDVDTDGPSTDITRRYLTLSFDHGIAPVNATYGYLLLPLATVAQTQAAAAAPGVDIIVNSPAVQAVAVPGSGLLLANFFAAEQVQRISADGPCSVVSERLGRTATLAVSDPTHHRDQVIITLECGAWASWEGTSTVSVRQEGGRAMITVDTSAHDGVTHTVTLRR